MEESCLLKISNSQYFNKFLHDCVDDLIGRTENRNTNYTSDIEWTKSEHLKARNLIQTHYKQNILNEEFSTKFAGLSLKDQELIKECFELRKEEILQAVAKEKLLDCGFPLVENFDWKLKWVMGCSKLASVSEPLLQMDLSCLEDKNGEKRRINFEMDLEQLDGFIDELETAKTNLQL